LKIRYLKHNQINFIKWNKCIAQSVNEIIYAYVWYLEIVSENWEALVEGDYKSVMPLTYRKKYGIKYLAQPDFTQQLGVFSSSKLDVNLVENFIKAIPKKYKLIEIKFNLINKIENSIFETKLNVNYHLDLIEPYKSLYKKYSTNTKQNIKKSIKNGIYITNHLTANELIRLFAENVGDPLIGMKIQQYDVLRKLISYCLKNNIGKIYSAFDSSNTLCGAVFLIYTKGKIISLISVSSAEGKENRAMFQIFDYIIKTFSEKHFTLDFEGSNIPGIARFNKGFGATPCEYFSLSINKLPWFIKMFKK